MSDCSSECSEISYISDVNENNNYLLETEQEQAENDDDYEAYAYTCIDAYGDEPIADQEWLRQYNQHQEEQENQEEEFKRRLDSTTPLHLWCKCGNCRVDLLLNASECYCCQEIDSCISSLEDELVTMEVGSTPSCITLHPGFRPVCLERWSLRMSAAKYKKKDRTRYKKTAPENRFMRSVAYRRVTHMVHGYLAGNRIPLPACAYHVIRQTFKEEEEEFRGFDMDNL